MIAPVNTTDPEAAAIQSLLQAVLDRYGFDFRDYAATFLKRRVGERVQEEGLGDVAELQAKLLDDSDCMERFLRTLTINVTAMFRDPGFYRALRTRVVPLLQALPFVRIWHVGCATGEEVYSMAILLQEEGLYSKCRIYATDVNEAVLAQAKVGIFPISGLQDYTGNYLKAAGTRSFSEYYTALYDHVVFQRALAENVVFAQHNLVTDASFNEFHLILCRNVLIYFNEALAARVHGLLYESLAVDGFLGLGSKESVQFSPHEACYEEFDHDQRIYRRIK